MANFRIMKYARGWVVEVEKKTWWNKKYWTHYVSVAGISEMPWYHSSYMFARKSLTEKIKRETLETSMKYSCIPRSF